MTNPLLDMLDGHALPPFDEIEPQHAETAVDTVLDENRRGLAQLLKRPNGFTWDNLIAPLEALNDRLARVWAPISHMNAVMNSPAWRKAHNACLPKLSDYHTELGQNEDLFRAFKSIADGAQFAQLDTAQQKLIRDQLRDFRLSGVALPAQAKARYKAIAQRLSELSTQFEENLLDATQAWTKPVTDEAQLAGLPNSAKAQARRKAADKSEDGWLLTLDLPSYVAVMTFAEDRGLRREVYEAFTTRASELGPHSGRFDNRPIMDEILALRHEMAGLLGFANYTEQSLATKMAHSPDQVIDFLQDLARRTLPRGRDELATLRAFARERDGLDRLEAWDVAFYAERLKQQRHRLSDEDLRPYFPAPRVIRGLFEVVRRLYGVTVTSLPDAPVWHELVTAYEIRDADGHHRGHFYVDMYERENKRGGAWMADCVNRRRTTAGVQHPVAFITCNFAPPVDGHPALLKHDDVITLFHEFGHSLHHMLTRVDYAGVSGINGVPWDAVELPSQFMENWCWEREALDLFAAHFETGEKLPAALFERMQAARNFHAAMQMLRQLEFALFDFRLHREYDPAPGARVQAVLDEVRDAVAVMKPPPSNRFANSFAHIFAGGYAAGYYSYKWAEVLSADAFSAFEEAGIFDAATGRRFMTTILERGGSADAMELFKAFRGREPGIDALLRHSGLAA